MSQSYYVFRTWCRLGQRPIVLWAKGGLLDHMKLFSFDMQFGKQLLKNIPIVLEFATFLKKKCFYNKTIEYIHDAFSNAIGIS